MNDLSIDIGYKSINQFSVNRYAVISLQLHSRQTAIRSCSRRWSSKRKGEYPVDADVKDYFHDDGRRYAIRGMCTHR